MRAWSGRKTWPSVAVVVAALALTIAACGADDIADNGAEEDAPDDTGMEDEDAEAADEDAVEEEASGDRASVRWATSDVGSYGYAVASYMVDFLNRELPDEYVVTVHPYPSTTAAMKAAMDGEAEISYTADVGMVEYFARGGPYEGYEPEVGDLVHTFYAYPMESFLVTTEDGAAEFATYGDFDGEPVYFTPAGFMNWLNFGRIFDALGYEFNHVEIDSAAVADSMQGGTIVGAGSYTTAGTSLPTWWREAELRTDLHAVEFTEEELEALESAGLSVSEIDPSIAFSQDLGVDRIQGVPILFGYNVLADTDEDFVYQMLTIFEDNLESLQTLEDGFGPLADDFVGTQVGGIRAAPDIPVHAGLARFLEENDAWDDGWTIAD